MLTNLELNSDGELFSYLRIETDRKSVLLTLMVRDRLNTSFDQLAHIEVPSTQLDNLIQQLQQAKSELNE
jgi:hypothetical protein